MKVHVITPRELGDAERASWRGLQASLPVLRDPFLSPEWACVVAAERPDARVAMIEDAGQWRGFLAVQKRSAFTAMGIGAPICDYDGLVAAPGADIRLRDLPCALGVDRIDLGHCPAGVSQTDGLARSTEQVLVADMAQWPSFIAARRAEGSSTLRNLEKKRRKLAREHGELEMRVFTKDADAFALMMDWKEAQLVRTRQPNILARAWCRGVHERALAENSEGLTGTMVSLRAGGRVAAAMLCLRGPDRLHAWMIAHDPELSAYSPGSMVWHEMMEAAAAAGIAWVDFGCGDYPYKRFYANATQTIGAGFIGRPSVASTFRGGLFAMRGMMERARSPAIAALPGKAMRRLDLYRALGPA